MKKKRLIICALTALVCVTFSGCAKVYELTEADEELIAVYCAKTVSKFNTIKTQGYTNLIGQDLKDLYALQEEPQQMDQDTAISDGTEENPEEELPADATDNPNSTTDTDETDVTTEATSSSSLTDALSIEGLTFDYKSVAAMDYYSISGGWAEIRPTSGRQFLVMTYNVVNSTDKDVAVDVLNSGIKFKASVGGVSNTADGTAVPTDLSVYQGTIPAGHTQEMVLIFQFAPDALSDLSGLKLSMVNGTTVTNIIF